MLLGNCKDKMQLWNCGKDNNKLCSKDPKYTCKFGECFLIRCVFAKNN